MSKGKKFVALSLMTFIVIISTCSSVNAGDSCVTRWVMRSSRGSARRALTASTRRPHDDSNEAQGARRPGGLEDGGGCHCDSPFGGWTGE